jgi:2',3'-cyclic-nucleotide 2'-phosphodiesterase (5'-nucleotidase family)
LTRGDEEFAGQNFPLISANIVETATGRPVFRPGLTVGIQGVPVAFVGATTVFTPALTSPGATDWLTFLDEAGAIDRQVSHLRDQGVQAVVLLLHEGGKQTSFPSGTVSPRVSEITAAVPGLKVVLAGHNHHTLNPQVKGCLVVQPAPFGRAFSDISLVLDRDTKRIVTASAEIVPAWRFDPPASGHPVPGADDIQRIVDGAVAAVAPITGRVVNTAAHDLRAGRGDGATAAGESPLGNLIADAHRHSMGTRLAFLNPGGIRAELRAGPVTWGDLFAVQPCGNRTCALELTGRDVWNLLDQQNRWRFKRNLEVSGLHYGCRLDSSGKGVVGNVYEGSPGNTARPIPPDSSRTYTVAVNSFLAAGGDHYSVFTHGRNLRTGPVASRQRPDFRARLSHRRFRRRPRRRAGGPGG